jgi:hypothetical protein
MSGGKPAFPTLRLPNSSVDFSMNAIQQYPQLNRE